MRNNKHKEIAMPIHNVNGVDASDGEVNKVLPPGKYPAEIISAEWGESKNQDSEYFGAPFLKLGVKTTDEETEIAVTSVEIFMLPFPTAMDADGIRRSLAKLKELQMATDTEDMGDEIDNDRFVHQNCTVELYIAKAKDGYPEQNKVRSYMPA